MDKSAKEQLLGMSKEQLVELLELALDGQMAANANMVRMSALVSSTVEKMQKLEDEKATLEAELIMLRNRP